MASAAKIRSEEFATFADKATADTMVARAKELRPFLMAEAPAGEAQRSPTKAVEKSLFDNKILFALLPKRLGGVGLSLTDFCRMQSKLPRVIPQSVGLCRSSTAPAGLRALRLTAFRMSSLPMARQLSAALTTPRERRARLMAAGLSMVHGLILPGLANQNGLNRALSLKDMMAPSCLGSACAISLSRI